MGIELSEQITEKFFLSKDFIVERFEKLPNIQDPDYKVSTPGGGFFICEVKSIQREIKDGITHNQKHRIIARKIHESLSQFESRNKGHFAPNVLIIYSHQMLINQSDMYDFMNGKIAIDNMIICDIRKLPFNKEIQNDYSIIDLIIWILDDLTPFYFLAQHHQEHLMRLKQYFKLKC